MAKREKTRKKQWKAAGMVAGILSFESMGIVGMMMLAGKPPEVEAAKAVELKPIAEEDRIVEIQILDASLTNDRTGVTYIYDVDVFVQVRRRNVHRVADQLDQYAHQIRAEIGALWRAADPRILQEPKLETLTGQVYALLEKRFGQDTARRASIVIRTVILMGAGYRAD